MQHCRRRGDRTQGQAQRKDIAATLFMLVHLIDAPTVSNPDLIAMYQPDIRARFQCRQLYLELLWQPLIIRVQKCHTVAERSLYSRVSRRTDTQVLLPNINDLGEMFFDQHLSRIRRAVIDNADFLRLPCLPKNRFKRAAQSPRSIVCWDYNCD